MAAGAGEVDAWAAHGAAAAARAQRVMAAVRLARARAEAELAAARHATEADPRFAWRPRSTTQQHTTELREARSELRRLRLAARTQLAEEEAARRLAQAREQAAKAADDARRAEEEARKADELTRKRGQAESLRRAQEAEDARRRAEAAAAQRLAAAEEAKNKAAAEDAKRKADADRLQKQRAEEAAKKQAEDDLPSDAMEALETLTNLEREGKPFADGNSSEVKRARLDVRRAINKACNQMSGSQAQVERCARALADALRHAATHGPTARAWALAHVARRLVEGGEDAGGTLSQFAWAYTVAATLRQLGNARQQLEDALYAALLDTAPAVAAHFPRRTPGVDTAVAYRQRLRARTGENADAYAARAAKACALFAALCQCCDAAVRLSMPALWRWLARVINARPHPLKTQLTVAVLEIAGFELSRCYTRQFAKLMAAVQQRVLKKADKRAPPGPTANLADLVTTFVKDSGRFVTPPKGKLLPKSDARTL